MVVSIPARAVRLILVVLVADWLNRRLAQRLTPRQRGGVLAMVWLIFYGVYFAVMPN